MNNEYNVGNQEINFLNNIYIKLDYIIVVININIMFFISFIIIIIMIITTLIPTNKY
jgi:ABC-type lipoprotein release transport system permease subunit